MKTTGKYSIKPYECQQCGHEFETGSNHWGEIYRCPLCIKSVGATICVCTEPIPEGYTKPPRWTLTTIKVIEGDGNE